MDPSRLERLATRHRLLPALGRSLSGTGYGLEAAAQGQYRSNQARVCLLAEEACAVARDLDAAGIRVVALKGLALALGPYADPGLRVMDDIDLLIDASAVLAVERILLQRGYHRVRPAHGPITESLGGEATFERPGGPAWLELHWKLHQYERYAPVLAIDGAGVIARAVPVPGAQPLLAPEPVDELCLLAAHHGLVHLYKTLAWVADIAVAARVWEKTIDRRSLRRRASAWGVAGSLYAGLRIGSAIFGAPRFGVGPPWAGPRLVAGRLSRPRAWHGRDRRLRPLAALLLLDSPAAALTALARGVLPGTPWRRARLGPGKRSIPAELWRVLRE